MNSDGTGQTRLTETSDVDESWPQWSPDGRKLIYIYWYHPSPLAIYIMDPDGRNKKLLFTGSLDTFDYPQWLPGSMEILFGCKKDQKWDIFKVDTGSSTETNLTNGSGNSYLYFSW